MDFITQNIALVSIVAVVLVMALIGYIAEKTDFGKKKKTVIETAPTKLEPVVVESKPVEAVESFEVVEQPEPEVVETPVEPIVELSDAIVEEAPISDFIFEKNTEEGPIVEETPVEETLLPELTEEVIPEVKEMESVEEVMPLPELEADLEPELDEDSVWKF